MSVLARGEVVLGGYRLPIRGQVTVLQASQFPAKLVTGDYSRDDEQLASNWVLTSPQGGHGLHTQERGELPDLVYFSTLETRYRNQIHIGPAFSSLGLNTSSATTRAHFVQVGATPFIVHDQKFWRWNGTSWAESTINPGNPKTVSDAFFGQSSSGSSYLEILGTDGSLVYVDGSGTQTLATGTFGTKGCLIGSTIYFWRDGIGLRAGSVPAGAGLATVANEGGPVGVQRVLVYADNAGNQTPWVIARNGAYFWDGTTTLKLAFSYPYTSSSATASCVWQGALYIAVGLDIYKFEGTGRTGRITNIGPNRLGTSYYSKDALIYELFGDHTFLYATVNDSTGVYLLAWTGQGWHTVYSGSPLNPNGGAGVLSDGQNYRLYYRDSSNILASPLSLARYNPLSDPTSQYDSSAQEKFLITPWFHGGWQELTKLALAVQYRLDSPPQAGERVTLAYQTDYYPSDSTGWKPIFTLTEGAPRAGKVRLPSEQNPVGVPCQAIRFRLGMSISNPNHTPVLRYLALRYVKVLDIEWGYSIEVDGTQGYGGLSAREIGERVRELASRRELLDFQFDLGGTVVQKRVRITRVSAVLGTGTEYAGRYLVSVVEVG